MNSQTAGPGTQECPEAGRLPKNWRADEPSGVSYGVVTFTVGVFTSVSFVPTTGLLTMRVSF